MNRKTATMLAALAVSATLVPFSGAQERRPGPFSQMVNVPALVDNYARFLARKYELSPEQEERTVSMLQQKTDAFLATHEDTIFDLYQNMLAVRGGGEMSSDELVDWGKLAMPIYQDAKEIIIGGNAEWRDMLTDEQKRMHDADVELMYESFQTTDDQLKRIVTGEMTVDEFRNPPKANRRRRTNRQSTVAQTAGKPLTNDQINDSPTITRESDEALSAGVPEQTDKERLRDFRKRPGNQPATAAPESENPDAEQAAVAAADGTANAPQQDRRDRPSRTADRTRRTMTPNAGENFESAWEKYVRDFITKYELDNGQKAVAEKILADCQEQAKRYLATRKSQIDKIDELLKEATGEKQKEAAALQTKRTKLLAPIDQIFEKQLKPRLDRIPTRAQQAAAEAPKAAKK
ncbi:MAG: hypothetical protein AB7N71_10525 [Phycisphaerae bacterium]